MEISEGTEQDFRRIYQQPGKTEQRNIGPLTYNYETTGPEGSVEHFAVFQSRDNDQIRVVIRDVTTGFPSWVQAHADIQPVVQQVIERLPLAKVAAGFPRLAGDAGRLWDRVAGRSDAYMTNQVLALAGRNLVFL